ncbi:Tetratricopeptide Repeat Protein 31 [Manis pentadactyla]|nr:Tetratricopeptide Repeat Protein 31 [Manis pentadactyla]
MFPRLLSPPCSYNWPTRITQLALILFCIWLFLIRSLYLIFSCAMPLPRFREICTFVVQSSDPGERVDHGRQNQSCLFAVGCEWQVTTFLSSGDHVYLFKLPEEINRELGKDMERLTKKILSGGAKPDRGELWLSHSSQKTLDPDYRFQSSPKYWLCRGPILKTSIFGYI